MGGCAGWRTCGDWELMDERTGGQRGPPILRLLARRTEGATLCLQTLHFVMLLCAMSACRPTGLATSTSARGMEAGGYSRCAFRRRRGGAAALVHGDDFLVAGRRSVLDETKDVLSKRWQIESVIVGPGPHGAKELLTLSCKVVWRVDCIDYHVDPRHAKTMVEEWLDAGVRPSRRQE